MTRKPPTDLTALRVMLEADAGKASGASPLSVEEVGNPRSGLFKTAVAFVALSGFSAAGLAVSAPVLSDRGADKAAAIAARAEIDIRVGRNDKHGRVEIYGTVGTRASVRTENGQVVIRLPGQKTPDIGDFRANPPLGVKSVAIRRDARATELVLTLEEGTKARFGRSDGAVYVQFESPEAIKEAAKLAVPPITPGAASGSASASETVATKAAIPVVAVRHTRFDDGAQVEFPFDAMTGAAVFRRGEAVWVVFDREVDLRLPNTLKDGTTITEANWVNNDGFTALRLMAPASGIVSVEADGPLWRVRLGSSPIAAPVSEVAIKRDDATGIPALTLNLAGAKRVAWIRDPVVGDRMAVIPAPGPVKAVLDDRSTLQASIGTTAQGVVVERMTPDVTVTVEGDRIAVSRPGGLVLSARADWAADEKTHQVGYQPAAYPTLMNMDNWSALPKEGFLKRYNALQEAAANEAALGPDGPHAARLELARFLVGQGLNFEAMGVLDWLGKSLPRSLDDPHVRGLRVIARMGSGRLSDATADLSSGPLLNDPAANLWRGYIAARNRHYEEARKAFEAGAEVLEQFPPEWRARFAAANARAALQMNDLEAASKLINYAVTQEVAPLERLEAQLIQAEIIEAQGDKRRAYNVYRAIAKASSDRIATPAQLRAARLKLELGEAKTEETLATLNSLRYRWRGDDSELEIVRTMGDIYLTQGRYREALEVLKSGGTTFFNRPDAMDIAQKLNTAFRSLFLEGRADGLQPVEALGLFYDFRDLTPVGADGDEMVRRLARRLVEVDLLTQAADLLQYQVDNRLQGVAKSQVAADIAAIHLMNRQPEKALQALWKTRTTLLPKAVMAERRVLEARALNELNRPDNALEVLGADASPEALDVRAEIYWRQKDWVKAGALLEKRLGERWKKEGPLTPAEESNLIRAGVAYSLASDQKGLDRLTDRFGKFAATAQNPDAMRVALAGMDNGPLKSSDFALAAAHSDSFAGWVGAMKQRFRDQGKNAPKPAPVQAAQTPPAAAKAT